MFLKPFIVFSAVNEFEEEKISDSIFTQKPDKVRLFQDNTNVNLYTVSQAWKPKCEQSPQWKYHTLNPNLTYTSEDNTLHKPQLFIPINMKCV